MTYIDVIHYSGLQQNPLFSFVVLSVNAM